MSTQTGISSRSLLDPSLPSLYFRRHTFLLPLVLTALTAAFLSPPVTLAKSYDLIKNYELIEHDAVSPPANTRAKAAKNGARQEGFIDHTPPPADAYSAALREYKKVLQAKIKKVWWPPKDGNGLDVRFMLSRSGKISDVYVARPSGLKICDDAGLKAIDKAQPLPKIPEELPAPLQANFGFADDLTYPGKGIRLYLPADCKLDAKAKSAISGSPEPKITQ